MKYVVGEVTKRDSGQRWGVATVLVCATGAFIGPMSGPLRVGTRYRDQGGLGAGGLPCRAPLLSGRARFGLRMASQDKEVVKGVKASKELQERISDEASDVPDDDGKKFDIGISQFQKVPNATWTGTTTIEKSDEEPELGVWGQTWDSALAAKVRKTELPWPALILDRALDQLEDSLQSSSEGAHAPLLRKDSRDKHRIVIIGSGWASHAFVKSLDASVYDVTLVSPRNYFLFTPMLAGAATGTVELRSITESIREANPRVNYLEATVTEVMPGDKKVSCQTVVCEGAECSISDFDVEYDTLVYGVGAGVNTFGIKGVRENCYFLKQVGDAARAKPSALNPKPSTLKPEP